MRKSYLLLSFFFLLVLALMDCKPEPKVTKTNNDPDSLYVGTKYTITVPHEFPQVTNAYARDSMTYEGVALGRRLFYD